MRGGEKCLEALCELYPDAPIYTLFCDRSKISGPIPEHPIHASWLSRLPNFLKNYRNYLPLFPLAVRSLNAKKHAVLISTSHCTAKGVKKGVHALHICYCFTPMRYAWGFFDEYFGQRAGAQKVLIGGVLAGLRHWDLQANKNVDHFVAISEHVKRRIRDCYRREAEVIYPPVDTEFYTTDSSVPREDYYLIASALVPYKRADMAIEAFTRLGKRLVIIGEGPERDWLEKIAGTRVHFLGWQTDEILRDHYRRARALIFPGEEDFGIVPLEMQACGGSVIAYGEGGALETVRDGKTGVFFKKPTVESLMLAVQDFEKLRPDPVAARENALKFSRERFKREMKQMIDRERQKKESDVKP